VAGRPESSRTPRFEGRQRNRSTRRFFTRPGGVGSAWPTHRHPRATLIARADQSPGWRPGLRRRQPPCAGMAMDVIVSGDGTTWSKTHDPAPAGPGNARLDYPARMSTNHCIATQSGPPPQTHMTVPPPRCCRTQVCRFCSTVQPQTRPRLFHPITRPPKGPSRRHDPAVRSAASPQSNTVRHESLCSAGRTLLSKGRTVCSLGCPGSGNSSWRRSRGHKLPKKVVPHMFSTETTSAPCLNAEPGFPWPKSRARRTQVRRLAHIAAILADSARSCWYLHIPDPRSARWRAHRDWHGP